MTESLPGSKVLGKLLELQAARYGGRTFLNFKGEQQVSYREIEERALQYANGFLKAGLRPGSKAAIILPNCPEYLYSWFGLAKIGAVMVPVNTAHKGELLKYIIENSDTEAVIADATGVERLAEIPEALKNVKRVFAYGQEAADLPGVSCIPVSELAASPAEPIDVEVRCSDPMSILFTSGTTGPSKGVVMSHNYYHYAARTIGGGMGVTSEDILYTCLPLFHVNAQTCTTLSALIHGAQAAMYDRFSATTFWDEVRSSKATVFLALGAMGNILYKAAPSPADADNRVRMAMVVPPPENLEDFESRFGLRVLYETFGLTEGIVAAPKIAEPRRPGCCGKPAKDTEVRIVDDDDEPLPAAATGEIVMRTAEPYSMMTGYYKMPEETLKAFRNLWFHTGDLGYMDADGYLYFVGRKKEAIRRRGENISAFEVERTVNQHPAVLESAAIPAPSEIGEDDVKIVIVPREGMTIEPLDIIRFCEDRMAYFMVPRFVEFRHALPKTPTLRIEKYKLKEEGNNPDTWDREKSGYKLKRS